MSLEVFQWVTFSAYIFFAIMVMFRFAFYKKRENAQVAVYFWGGLLFLSLVVADLTSNLFYKTEINVWQNLIFACLTVWTMYTAAKNRRVVAEMAVE
ncbi:hypothetical protein CIG75_15910 [Tumebacillus algifaecis]|uniref:Uncharacterized protein n=1 Tax=Tumebacillus algifaecis TaxID=1214604 RepID=A0A223D4D0_9BACL|nr:hypothetical protein [Tumebacillus algifaecis]ASS76283.1 hypothetical protein CIG75_15910 [Tumebacillus algifaecis]